MIVFCTSKSRSSCCLKNSLNTSFSLNPSISYYCMKIPFFRFSSWLSSRFNRPDRFIVWVWVILFWVTFGIFLAEFSYFTHISRSCMLTAFKTILWLWPFWLSQFDLMHFNNSWAVCAGPASISKCWRLYTSWFSWLFVSNSNFVPILVANYFSVM